MIYEAARRLLPPGLRRAIPAKLKRDVSKGWLVLDSFSRARRKVSFVQIGANDGLRWDLIHDLILRDGWEGILVEPLPAYFEALRKNYAGQPGLRFERAAIADTDGVATICRLDTAGLAVPEWLEGMATFNRELLLRHKDLHPDFERRIVAESVPALTLASLLAKQGLETAALFYIDAEGCDYQIVKQVFQLAKRPEIIVYEHNHLSAGQRAELEGELTRRSYRILFCENDTIATLGNYERPRLTDFLPFRFLKR